MEYSRREVKRYRAAVRGDSARRCSLYCHISLHCSTECSSVGSGAYSGSRHARPAQWNIELWRSVILSGSSLPIIRHSAHQCCARSFGSWLNDFTHWIYNTTISHVIISKTITAVHLEALNASQNILCKNRKQKDHKARFWLVIRDIVRNSLHQTVQTLTFMLQKQIAYNLVVEGW